MTVALYYQKQGQYELAHQTLTTAYQKAVTTGNVEVEALAHNNLGVQAEERGDFEQAGLHYEQAHEAAVRAQNRHMILLTQIACEGSKYMAGIRPVNKKLIERLLQEAIVHKSFLSAIDACITLSRINFEEKDFGKALVFIRKGIRLGRDKQMLYSLWVLKQIRGEISEARGKSLSAVRAYRSSLASAKRRSLPFARRWLPIPTTATAPACA